MHFFLKIQTLVLLSSLDCTTLKVASQATNRTEATTATTTTQESSPSNQSSAEVLFSSDEFVDHKEAPVLLFDGGLTTNETETTSTEPPKSATTTTRDDAVETTTTTSTVASKSAENATATTNDASAAAEDGGAENEATSDDESSENESGNDDETNRDNSSNSNSQQKQFKPPQNVSQYMDYIENLFHDLGHQITDLFEPHIPQLIRTSQMVELSGSCSYDMLRMALALRKFEPWALRMIDSSGKVPEGIFEGSFTALGSYDECLNTVFKSQSAAQAPPSPPTSGGGGAEKPPSATQGKYCLVNVSPFLPPKPPADKVERMFQEEANRRNYTKDDQFSRLSPMFYYMKFRIGVCIPSSCDQSDTESISQALSSSLRLNITIPDCRIKQAQIPLTAHQFAGGLVFASVACLVLVATLIDWSRRNWNQLVEQEFGALMASMNFSSTGPNSRAARGAHRVAQPAQSVVLTGMTKEGIDLSSLVCDSAPTKQNSAHHRDRQQQDGERRTTFGEQLEKHWTWMSFSLLANFRLYFQHSTTSKRATSCSESELANSPSSALMIKCLNGIRVLSLCWVMIANSYITLDPRATKRLLKTREAPRDFLFQLVVQASLAIETFFFLSGVLMSLSFSRHLASAAPTAERGKRRHDLEGSGDTATATATAVATTGRATFLSWLHFYVHRYVRMTPATMLVIAISMYAYRYGDGPLWFEATHRAHENCRDNWWRHLLHVANFIDTRQMCFIHYWYIAADMQLFLFAPLIMLLVYRQRRLGYSLIALIGATSIGFIFYTTYERNLPPTLLFYNSDPESRREFGNTIMTKPLTHALPYLVGMVVGHWLTKASSSVNGNDLINDGAARKTESSQSAARSLFRFFSHHGKVSPGTLLGSTATIVALVELFLPYKWNNSHLPSRFMASLYAALFRFGWSLVLAYVVVSCRHKRDRKCRRESSTLLPATDSCCCCGGGGGPVLHRPIISAGGDDSQQLQQTTPDMMMEYNDHSGYHCTNNNRLNHRRASQQQSRLSQQQRQQRTFYCFCGSGGNLINRLLSLNIFTHLSRLSFVAYLIHLPLMSVFISQTRGLFAFSHTLVIHLALSYLVMTFILSFILVHIIEFPFITFERYLFNNLLCKQEKRQKQSSDSQSLRSMRFVYENKSFNGGGEQDARKPSPNTDHSRAALAANTTRLTMVGLDQARLESSNINPISTTTTNIDGQQTMNKQHSLVHSVKKSPEISERL